MPAIRAATNAVARLANWRDLAADLAFHFHWSLTEIRHLKVPSELVAWHAQIRRFLPEDGDT